MAEVDITAEDMDIREVLNQYYPFLWRSERWGRSEEEKRMSIKKVIGAISRNNGASARNMPTMTLILLMLSAGITTGCNKIGELEARADRLEQIANEYRRESEEWRGQFDRLQETLPTFADNIDPLGIKYALRESADLRGLNDQLEQQVEQWAGLSFRYPFMIMFRPTDHNVRFYVWLIRAGDPEPSFDTPTPFVWESGFGTQITPYPMSVAQRQILDPHKNQVYMGARRTTGAGLDSRRDPNLIEIYGVRLSGNPPTDVPDLNPFLSHPFGVEDDNTIVGPYDIWSEWDAAP